MLKNLFKNKNTKENIFVHIPKSGGSTFVGLLKESEKAIGFDGSIPSHKIEYVGNTHIKHLDFNTPSRIFKGADIFNAANLNHYRNKYKLFMLVRNPIDRIISEFNFQYHILKGKEGNPNAAIFAQLRPRPNSLEEYVKFKETQDYQVKFLLGRKLADKDKVSQAEMDNLLETIKMLPIHCGLTEEYSAFLNQFRKETGKKLNRNVTVRKKTPFIYQTEISEDLRAKIIALNKFDFMLYESVKENLETIRKHKFYFKQNDEFIV